MDSLTINNILEFPKDYKFEKVLVDLNDPIVKLLVKTLQIEILKDKHIGISLSGGVDSMVLLCIAKELFPTITTFTVDYNQRPESSDETLFVNQFCKVNNIRNISVTIENISRKKEDSGKRSDFEEQSEDIRFKLYKSEPINLVINGHHLNDLEENWITNIFGRGKCEDGMNLIIEKKGVILVRPFLFDITKDMIFKIAHKYNIPYFKNTTPSWCKRGQMREQLIPLLDKMFGEKAWRANLQRCVNERKDFYKQTYEDFNKQVCYKYKYGFRVYIKMLHLNVTFCKLYFEHILKTNIKHNTIHDILNLLIEKKESIVSIGNKYKCHVINDDLYIYDTALIENLNKCEPKIVPYYEYATQEQNKCFEFLMDGKLRYCINKKNEKAIVNKSHILKKQDFNLHPSLANELNVLTSENKDKFYVAIYNF